MRARLLLRNRCCRQLPQPGSRRTQEVKVGADRAAFGPLGAARRAHAEGRPDGDRHINAQGGIKALGGAKLKLVVIDAGDSIEKAKNAAQRMVAQETDMVAARAPG